MSRFSPVIFLLSVILFVSCYSKTDDISNKDLVKPKDLVNILIDVHVAGGVLAVPDVSKRFEFKDSLSNYSDILEKYGYTRKQLDNTMKYYFVKKPKQLQEIYDKVLSQLSEMETTIDAEFPKAPEPVRNLWDGNLTYTLPGEGAKEAVWFDIPVQDTGTYELSLNVIVYSDDKSLDPGLTVFFWKDNGTPDGAREYWPAVSYTKDDAFHKYSVSKNLTDTTYTRIRGWLLDHKAQNGIWEKHLRAESILLTKKQVSNVIIE
jgi:hypothetical protein